MKVRVRSATERDGGLFKKLWTGVLETAAKEGSIMQSSEKTMEAYELLFNTYLSEENDFEGVVLLVADVGIFMIGDAASPFDWPGRPATVWGAYAIGDQTEEVLEALWVHAEAWAAERGFDGILLDSYCDTKLPEGFNPAVTVVYREIKKE